MHRPLRWMVLAGLALAATSVGCSREPSAPEPSATEPRRFDDGAPLLDKQYEAKYVDGRYIVVFNNDVSDVATEVNDVEKTHGFKADYRYSHAIKGFAARLPPQVVDALLKNPRVAYIEQDQVAHIASTETNPTWGLDRIDQRSRLLDGFYNYNQTGAGVDVYCIDTGIRFTHSDFGGRAVPGYDAINPGGSAADGNGHGTHTAGTIGGASYGVAKGAHLIAVRVLDDNGSGLYSQVIAGIDWVTGNHTSRPAVANVSLGGPQDAAIDDAVRNSIADGVTYCVSSGNSASDASTQSPADVGEAITVGATDSNDGWAAFSNYGTLVDVQAPGVGVTSAYYTSDTATATMSGTSMAAPHVTGAAALYLEANPAASPADVQAAIIGNATHDLISGLPGGTPNRVLYSLVGATSPVTPVPIPSSPSLNSPADGASGVTLPATVSWNAGSGAASYQVQVSTTPDFSMPLYDQAGITSSSATVSGLADFTLYYWRVNATNMAGTSEWSTFRSFTTAAGLPPRAPTLVSPRNSANAAPRMPTLDWNGSAGATSYHVQVSTNPAFTTTVYDNDGLTMTSTYVGGLSGRATYYWRVNASNMNGTSAWSSTWSFRTRR